MKEEKIMTMREAIQKFVKDNLTIYMGGFTHLIVYAATHEIIRQKKRNLTLCKETPELLSDQMIAAGCVRKLVFSWTGNPGVGLLHSVTRAIRDGIPHPIEIEEYDHFAFGARLRAGAMGLPFMPIRDLMGSDLPRYNKNIKFIKCPFTGQLLGAVPALNPDVGIVHVQRADKYGNAHIWGVTGLQRDIALASKRVIVTAEEIVDPEVIRRDPNRTLILGFKVDAVVEEPWGAHPSYAQGCYYRDNDAYRDYDKISRSVEDLENFLQEWIYGVENRVEYVKKLGIERILKLRVKHYYSFPVDYGQV